MAVNGRVLAGHHMDQHKFNPGREPDAVSVCSCTCYGSGKSTKERRLSSGGRFIRVYKPWYSRVWHRTLRSLGCHDFSGPNSDDGNCECFSTKQIQNYNPFSRIFSVLVYDEETQSISNHTRFAVKRASF